MATKNSSVMAEKIMCATTEEWSNARKGGIGGSDIPTIMGCNPYTTIEDWFEMRMGRKEAEPENNAMRMGHCLEPYIASAFAENHKELTLVEDSKGDYLLVDPKNPHRRVSPDREFTTESGERVLLECKSSHSWLDTRLATDGISDYWLLQVMWQMGISGIKKAYIAFMDTPRYTNCTIGELEIDFVPELFKLECEIADKVWQNLQTDTKPEELFLSAKVRELAKAVIEKAREPYAKAKAEADAEKARKKAEKDAEKAKK